MFVALTLHTSSGLYLSVCIMTFSPFLLCVGREALTDGRMDGQHEIAQTSNKHATRCWHMLTPIMDWLYKSERGTNELFVYIANPYSWRLWQQHPFSPKNLWKMFDVRWELSHKAPIGCWGFCQILSVCRAILFERREVYSSLCPPSGFRNSSAIKTRTFNYNGEKLGFQLPKHVYHSALVVCMVAKCWWN